MNHNMGYNITMHLLTGMRIQAAKHLASEMGHLYTNLLFDTQFMMFIVDTHFYSSF